MPSSAKQVYFKDYVFDVSEHVYEPAEDSFLFAEYLLSESGKHVLDMGTGCGILGVVAATNDSRVVAIDINPYAVRCARENAKLNHVVDKFSFIGGDLFGSLNVNVMFDLILFNPPYLPTNHCEGKSWLEHAWAGGINGRRIIDKFLSQSSSHLMPGGRILLLQSTLSSVEETLKSFNGIGFRTRILTKENLSFFESIVLIEARHWESKSSASVPELFEDLL